MSAITYTSTRGANPNNAKMLSIVSAVQGAIGVDPVDLVTNGGFDTSSDWTLGTGWTIGSGVATNDGTGLDVEINQTPSWGSTGTIYAIEFEITAYTSGSVAINIGGISGVESDYFSAVGAYKIYYVTVSGEGSLGLRTHPSLGFTGSVDNVSLYPVSQLVENGTFYRDFAWAKGSGWTIGSGVASKSSGTESEISQSIAWPVIGTKVLVKFDIVSYTAGGVAVNIGGTGLVDGDFHSSVGTYAYVHTVTGSEGTVGVRGNASFVGSIDNVEVYPIDVEEYTDLSLPFITRGQLTGASVATGSELVSFSGFSSEDYFEQLYDSTLDVGAGDFSFDFGFDTTSTSSEYILVRGAYSGGYSGAGWYALINNGIVTCAITDDGFTTVDTVSSTTDTLNDGSPHTGTLRRIGSTLYLDIDGVNEASTTITASTGSLSNTSATLLIGVGHDGSSANTGGIFYYRFQDSTDSIEASTERYDNVSRMFKKYSALQVIGESYSLDIDHSELSQTDEIIADTSRSYGGNRVTIIEDEETKWRCTTNTLEDLELDKFREFLNSARGEEFTFDPYGSVASSYQPFTGILLSNNHSMTRKGQLHKFTISYQVVEV